MIYLPGDTWIPDQFASLLAIGDSWFWYPRNDILRALTEHPRLKEPYRNIQVFGYNGAKIEEYVFGKYAEQFSREMEARNRQYYSAILISGAGNDAVDYRLGLFRNCAKADRPEQCFNDEGMDALLSKVGSALGALIDQIRRAYAKDKVQPDIILHSYDYPIPDGRGFALTGLQVVGPWLAKAMDDCFVPADMALRKGICRILIDHLHDEFNRFVDPGNKVHLIDSRGCLTAPDYLSDWDNELHPTMSGFREVIDKRWIPVLADLGYAR